MSISPTAKAVWRDMLKNRTLERVLKDATYYVIVRDALSSHEGAKNQVKMNMMFYLPASSARMSNSNS